MREHSLNFFIAGAGSSRVIYTRAIVELKQRVRLPTRTVDLVPQTEGRFDCKSQQAALQLQIQ